MRAIIVTTAEMNELFQVTRETISQWTQAGMPKVGHGKFDLSAVFDWWRENINVDDQEQETASARERYWNAKAEEAELKVGQARGQLMPVADVHHEWACRAAELKSGLRAWASRLAPKVEGKDLVDLRVALRDAADELLRSYCRSGRFTQGEDEAPAKKQKKGKKR